MSSTKKSKQILPSPFKVPKITLRMKRIGFTSQEQYLLFRQTTFGKLLKKNLYLFRRKNNYRKPKLPVDAFDALKAFTSSELQQAIYERCIPKKVRTMVLPVKTYAQALKQQKSTTVNVHTNDESAKQVEKLINEKQGLQRQIDELKRTVTALKKSVVELTAHPTEEDPRQKEREQARSTMILKSYSAAAKSRGSKIFVRNENLPKSTSKHNLLLKVPSGDKQGVMTFNRDGKKEIEVEGCENISLANFKFGPTPFEKLSNITILE